MIAFATNLIEAARNADMAIPEDLNDHFPFCDRHLYPHFYLFCVLQLYRPVAYHGEHWDNAKVIAQIPRERLMAMTVQDFAEAGVSGLHRFGDEG
jgi:hypothetical protein